MQTFRYSNNQVIFDRRLARPWSTYFDVNSLPRIASQYSQSNHEFFLNQTHVSECPRIHLLFN